jgi:hypothetical protein
LYLCYVKQQKQVIMSYKEKKATARQKAIDWSTDYSLCAMSYGEIAEANVRFAKLGRRYGLTREFRENGII